MKSSLRLLLALLALPAATLWANEKTDAPSKNCGCACCKGKATCCCNEETSAEPAPPDQAKRYPLKGVIMDILADQTALLVKHEAIPGYMKAMTMLLKVDAATLAAATKGQAITATLVERADGFWLEDVQSAK
ncbi:Copper binding periplasmic protein CusF [Lacunisphaera limnophila]|uniref:Copper binding periplasmic protein CusF n=1 Tax=Lacunisphaera limnophila TaxID=1838286 RepID=A0A1D8ARJ5_9BACT|nr:copper-binding protein [Lacunisphaera limnophila]AOS43518.1 Copper binding periplasmic protein CusF [Lacunisphaera limnophila]